MKRILKISLLSLMSLLVTSCANTEITPQQSQAITIPLNNDLFDIREIKLISQEEIFKLSPEQQQAILAYLENKIATGMPAHQAVRAYLQNRLSNFTYYGATYTAEKALALNKGNCMSLAILTTAVAKLANVDFEYREVSTLPVFKKQNNLLLSSSHVQTLLFDPTFVPKEDVIYFSRPAVVVDYFPESSNHSGRYFSLEPFLAMFYKNIASDALVANQLELAFANAAKAYELDPSNVRIANMMAVIHRRMGDDLSAEKIYQTALKIDENNIALISNYMVLLESQGRIEQAQLLSGKLDNLDDPNPYSWLEQAYIAQKQGEHRRAIHYYNKVLDIAPYVHQAYQGLAQVYRKQGKIILARNMLKNALEWTYELTDRKAYKYKLYHLESRLPTHLKRDRKTG